MTSRIIKLLVSLLVRCLDACLESIYQLAGTASPGTCVVLYYHAVTSRQQPGFRGQMEFLKSVGIPVPAGYSGPLEPGSHYAAVTFDDGFASFIDHALPVLQKLQIPAAVFVPAGFLGQRPGWMHDAAGSEIIMSAAQIAGLAQNPLITIGSHCLKHRNLLHLESAEAQQEIRESKRILENILGKEVRLLSFPHGAYSQAHLNQAGDAGYSRAFGILPVRFSRTLDALDAGRVAVEPDDWPLEFRLKLLGAYRWLPYAFRLKRMIRRASGAASS